MKFEFGDFDEKEIEKKGEAYKIEKAYKISKQELLRKLSLNNENVTYIAYDYKKGELTIKTR